MENAAVTRGVCMVNASSRPRRNSADVLTAVETTCARGATDVGETVRL